MKHLNENAMLSAQGNPKNTIVLLGNLNTDLDATDARARKVEAFGIGKANFDLGFNGQLLVVIPKTKVRRFLETFPIVEGVKYWNTTHYWDGATT